MKKVIALLLIMVFCLTTLNGCFAASYLLGKALGEEDPAQPSPSPIKTARPEKPEPTAQPTETPDAVSAPTADFSDANALPADIHAYFSRVGFGDIDGDKFILKWTEPIRVQVIGQPTAADMQALDTLIGQLQQVEGMPGISIVSSDGNLRIGYVPESRGTEIDESFTGGFAHVYMRWDDFNNMTSVNIIITDEMTDQTERDSNMIGFVFRGLGLQQDADSEYVDSILNFNEIVASPNSLDWTMLLLLYNAQMVPNMTYDQAMAVVSMLVPEEAGDGTATSGDGTPSSEEVLTYFNEVGFYWAENAADGVVLKWGAPITLQIVGTPSAEDRQLLDTYVGYLNSLEGFPGITEVASDGSMVIYYLPYSELVTVGDFAGMARENACYYWIYWDDYYSINKCNIAVATDFGDPSATRLQFLDVLIRSLGFLYASSNRYPDSILNPESIVQDWSVIDWAMVALIYNPIIVPGASQTDVMAMLNTPAQ